MNSFGTTSGSAGLFSDLKAECQSFEEFHEILQAEEKALTSGEIDKLVELARRKSEKVVVLSGLAEKRNRFLIAQSLTPDQQGMARWLELNVAEQEGNIGKAWRRLVDVAQRARRLNETNGAMIEAKLRYNQQALAVFQSAATQLSLYGPDGKTHSPGSIRPLGKV